MKKRMLLGAAGLALAGVSVASVYAAGPRSNALAFIEMRNAALGETGSSARAEVLAQLRDAIAAGTIDPRTVLFAITEDLIPGSGNAPGFSSGVGTGAEAAGGAPLFGRDDFTSYVLTNYLSVGATPPLNGQTNIAGQVFGGDAYIGAADSAAMTNPMNLVQPPDAAVPLPPGADGIGGIVAGMDRFAALARREGSDPLNTAFALGMNYRHGLLTAGQTAGTHARLATDWYLIGSKTSEWWSPVSFTEGFVADRVFFGGTQLGGVLGFFQNPSGILENFVSLGVLPGNFTIGQFYGSQLPNSIFPFPVGEWFSLMYVQARVGAGFGQGLFFKSDATTNGVGGTGPTAMDPRLANGSIIAVDKNPAGWVNLYPGFDDDTDADLNPITATPNIVEGIGQGVTQFGELGPRTGALHLSPLLAAITLSGMQFGQGLDPPASVVPGFVADDAFYTNYTFAGVLAPVPCPLPDFILPYTEDWELYTSDTAVRFQTDRIFDNISSNAVVSTLSNSTAGGQQSLANQNINSDNLFRQEDNTSVPVFPLQLRATTNTATPVVVKAMFNISKAGGGAVNPRTSRGLLINDAGESGQPAAFVILGGRDKSDGSLHGVYVRQPSPTYNKNEDSDANLVDLNSIDESLWAIAPPVAQTPFNLEFRLVSTTAAAGTGVDVPANGFFPVEVRIIQNPNDDPKNPDDNALMRVFIDGTEVFPNGVDASGGGGTYQWLAGGTTVSTVQLWSGNEIAGNTEASFVDDINLSGPTFQLGTGGDQPFALPFTETFETYDRNVTIDGAGSTTFRNLASTPDNAATDASRQLTMLVGDGGAPVSDGTMVCRYTVNDPLCVDVASSGLEVGSTYAINFDALAPVFNTFIEANTDCPGAGPSFFGAAANTPVVTRPAENAARVEEGTWALQNSGNDPVVYTAAAFPTDIINAFSYSATTSSRWTVLGADVGGVVGVDPTGAPINGVTAGNDALRVDVLADNDGTLDDHVIFGQIASILPDAFSGGSFPDTNFTDAVLQWRQYIESVDQTDSAIAAAPRSRMEVAVFGATADGGRITFINFGGPDVNNRTGLLDSGVTGAPVSPPGSRTPLPDTNISYAIAGPAVSPDFSYVDTGVSVVPMVNKWVTCKVTVHTDDTWDLDIDSGAGFVPIVVGATAIDMGVAGQAGGFVNTSGVGSFNVDIGNDFGSGGSPVPTPIRIHTFLNGDSAKAVPGNWDDRGPTNATLHPNDFQVQDDYCFYETTTFDLKNTADPAKVLDVDPLTTVGDPATDVRDLSENNDTIAVLNRAFDTTARTVSGPLIHDPCPFNVSIPKNEFNLFKGDASGTSQFQGRWTLDGQAGQAGVNNPNPPGSVNRPDGPFTDGGADTVSDSYNDPAGVPANFPGGPVGRPMILAGWGDGTGVDLDGGSGNAGVDPLPVAFPPQRYFFDDVSISELAGGPTCFGDINGSGAVDGTDISSVLNDFGHGSIANGGDGNPITNPANDVNGDGVVDSNDLNIVLNQFGPCP